MDTILKNISFKNLSNWSVAHLLANDFNYNQEFPLVRVGNFLTRNKTRIEIEDETIYKRVTIRLYNKGVKLRNTEIGKNIGTKKQFLIKKGHFLLSKIDARNGAFGIATSEIDGAIITADFFAYDIDETKIDPSFLVLITTTKQFQKFAQSSSSGTTGRQRIDENRFLNVKIPLPTLALQRELVGSYQKNIDLASFEESKKNRLLNEIEESLHKSLGVSIQSSSREAEILEFCRFKDLNIWSIEKLKQSSQITSKKYDLISMGEICNLVTDGTHQTPKYTKTGVIFLSAKNVTEEEVDWKNIKYVSLSSHQEYCKRVNPVVGDILLAKNGTTGVAAIVKKDIDFSIYVSLALLKPKKELVNPNFLLFLINSSIARVQFSSRLVGVGVQNLHLKEIREVKIPLPPLNIQNNIVNEIEILKAKVKNSKKEKIHKLSLAKEEFEKGIFCEIS